LKYREKYNFKEGKCLSWIIMNWLFGDAKTIRGEVKGSFGECKGFIEVKSLS
jgi:hypothetical protein